MANRKHRWLEIICVVLGSILLVLSLDCACSSGHRRDPVTRLHVVQACKLPPKPVLPTPRAILDGDRICYTAAEALKLKERDARLKQWVREALLACPAEAWDAGSPDTKD